MAWYLKDVMRPDVLNLPLSNTNRGGQRGVSPATANNKKIKGEELCAQ